MSSSMTKGEHRLTTSDLGQANSFAARWSAEDPTIEWSVSERMVKRGPVNVQAFFVHRGPAPRSFFKHDRFIAGKVVT
jgi:hypothetical protein